MRKRVFVLLLAIVAFGMAAKLRRSSAPVRESDPDVEFVSGDSPSLNQSIPASPTAEAAGEIPVPDTAASEPWKVIPPEPEVVRERYDATLPLTRDLIFVQPCTVRVTRGFLRVPVGVHARLVQDQGTSADVKVGGAVLNVPRLAVASTSSEKVTVIDRPAAMLAGVTGFFEKLFTPLPNNLGIDVKEIGTGKGIDRKWESGWGSYERDFYHTKGLQVDVRNVSRSASGNCQAEVYWFGRRLADKKLIIHHRETLPLEVGPITSVSRRFWSPLAASSVDKYVLLDITRKAGASLDGWAVVITRDGKILAGRGSGPEQDSIAHSESNLGTLVSAYTPTGRSATAGMPTWRSDQARKDWSPDRGSSEANGWQAPRKQLEQQKPK